MACTQACRPWPSHLDHVLACCPASCPACCPRRVVALWTCPSGSASTRGAGASPRMAGRASAPASARHTPRRGWWKPATSVAVGWGWGGQEALQPMPASWVCQVGMEDVRNKRCEYPGCKRQVYLPQPGQQAKFCKEHALEGMADVKNKQCEHPGCTPQLFSHIVLIIIK